ncbi:ABC transporter ATP-binding protein [Bosea massiliensis]|uniref:ABC transporter ATP-binding protein n=1 Tax=Bosea massiliensis TaxID=151419 RepID=A0ABW0P837_9HYPH
MTQTVVRGDGIGKLYRVYRSAIDRLVPSFLNPGRRPPIEIWSLRDIDLSVPKGACLGVIGRNGAGKSTLLKVLTGVTRPTEGELVLDGSVLALLELGAGFNAELTGRENVVVSATLLGVAPATIQAKLAEIEAFADIGAYFEKPVKTYSSGMFVRLAFSLYVNLEPDVLIVDEALSVGDFFFQQKCAKRIREIKERGTTIVFVSHDTSAVQELCEEVIILEKGKVVMRGTASDMVSHYHTCDGYDDSAVDGAISVIKAEPNIASEEFMAQAALIKADDVIATAPSTGGTALRLLGLRMTDTEGQSAQTFKTGDQLIIQALIRGQRTVRFANFGVQIADSDGRAIWAASTTNQKLRFGEVNVGDEMIVDLSLELQLPPGRYVFNFAAGEADPDDASNPVWHDTRVNAATISIVDNPIFAHRRGIVFTPMSCRAL